MANEGLFRLGFPILKMVHNPGGPYYWEGGQPNLYSAIEKGVEKYNSNL